jgi:hypothetical protein
MTGYPEVRCYGRFQGSGLQVRYFSLAAAKRNRLVEVSTVPVKHLEELDQPALGERSGKGRRAERPHPVQQ